MSEWDERYLHAHESGSLLFPPTPTPTVVEALDHVTLASPRPSAIDVGAGEGRHSFELARRGFSVTALEGSQVAVGKARERARLVAADVRTRAAPGGPPAPQAAGSAEGRIEWVAGDVRRWEPSSPVDLVLVAFLHQAEFTVTGLMPRLSSWVAQGGWLLLVGHSRAQADRDVSGPKDPARLWDPTDVAESMRRSGLEVVEARDVEHPRGGDGSGQSGDWAVDAVCLARRPRAGSS
jgi:methyltransferase type 12